MSETRITEAQSASLQDFKDDLASEAHGMTVAEAHAQNVCINCKKPPTFYSDDGRGEYQISGLCEPCFDEICTEPDEGDYCETCCLQIGEGGQTKHEPICPLETLRVRAEAAEAKLTALSAILNTLKALHEEATPAPWSADGGSYIPITAVTRDGRRAQIGRAESFGHISDEEVEANAGLIKSLRNALPELLRVMER